MSCNDELRDAPPHAGGAPLVTTPAWPAGALLVTTPPSSADAPLVTTPLSPAGTELASPSSPSSDGDGASSTHSVPPHERALLAHAAALDQSAAGTRVWCRYHTQPYAGQWFFATLCGKEPSGDYCVRYSVG